MGSKATHYSQRKKHHFYCVIILNSYGTIRNSISLRLQFEENKNLLYLCRNV